MGNKRLVWFLLGVLAVMVFGMYLVSDACATIENVTSSEITEGAHETMVVGAAGSILVQGGNITEVNISHKKQTDWWQGVWGSTFVNLTLEDASGEVFYNWGDTDATGEVYFYNESITDWSGISNMTDAEFIPGQLIQEWANSTGIDNLTNTYLQSNNHPAFDAGAVSFRAGDAHAVNLDTGHNCTALRDTTNNNYLLFVALISQDLTGFNDETDDYECLLPVNAAEAIVTYYVYAELD